MLVIVCDLNFSFFFFFLPFLVVRFFYNKPLETVSENYWAMFVMQMYLGSM